MALTLCHTGDWHLGHTLYRRSREHEHARFLAWLAERLEERDADALVVTGDVFDSGTPPGSALAMFYGFLAEVRRRTPELTVVVVAGNHDSPARLAAPDPILREMGVAIVGSVPWEGGRMAAERLVVPIVRRGVLRGHVVAVPFLRGADLPPVEDGADAHARGARTVYDAALAHARDVAAGEPIVVTGHFAAAGARMSRESERALAVGVDGTLPLDVIDTSGVAYVALGHLHLAQRVPAPVEAVYSGSPIPLSFAERGYEHEVRFVTIDGARTSSEAARVPCTVALRRLPEQGALDREGALAALASIPARVAGDDDRAWPWIEVRATARPGERDLLEAIEAAASERAAHLAHVVIERPDAEMARVEAEARSAASLDVRDVLVARWAAEHGEPPTASVLEALAEATAEARVRMEQRKQRGVELETPAAPLVMGASLVASPVLAARRRELPIAPPAPPREELAD